MDNPVSTIKNAATSALTVRNLALGFFTFLALAAIADLAGATPWLLTPVSKFKSWNAARKTA